MSETGSVTMVRVVSNADLRAGRATEGLEDPDGIARIPDAKRRALLANPLLGPDAEAVQLVATAGDRVIGKIDLVVGELDTADGAARCFWGSALYVSPDFRGRRVGDALLRAAEEQGDAAGACGTSRAGTRLYLKLGYRDLALPRYVLVRRTRPLVEKRLGHGVAARVASAVGDAGAAAHHGLLRVVRAAGARGLACEPCEAFPPELGPRLRERTAPVAAHRSPAWIDWLLRESFADDPGRRRALYLVRRDGEAVAYFLVKARRYSGVTQWELEDLDLGSLVDWRIFEPDAVRLRDVVLLAVEALRPLGVAATEVCVPPGEHVALGRLGFVHVGEQHLPFRARPGGPLDRPELEDARHWSIRPAEGDHGFS